MVLGETHREDFSEKEWKGACFLAKKASPGTPPHPEMIRGIAMFGSYLGRKGDGVTVVKTLWLGFARLRGFETSTTVWNICVQPIQNELCIGVRT